MPAIRAVVFDVYGTLFHNEQSLWQQTFARIVSEQKLPVDPMTLYAEWRALERQFRKRRINWDTITQVLPYETYERAWHDCLVQVYKKFHFTADTHFGSRLFVEGQATRQLFGETRPALNILRGKYKLAALSNADAGSLRTLMDSNNLTKDMDVVLSSEEAQAYKPVPSAFQAIIKRLALTPDEIAYVGDTILDDVQGSQSVGMRGVWINRTNDAPQAGDAVPDAEIKTLLELPKALIELGNRPGARTAKA
ncbi:MAG: HAD family hydrolase [Dehalococcoidia bacterium]|nr:HAD family hydrolase [Dehalococcoidia bacterium]